MGIQLGFFTSAPFHDWLQVHVTNFAGYYGGYIWEGYIHAVPVHVIEW